MSKNNKIIAAVVVVVLMGASFYGGMVYAKSGTGARANFANGTTVTFTRGMGAGGMAGGRGFTSGGFTAGKIISNSGTSISIQQQNGSSSEIVLISPSTQILKSASGTASDLTEGTQVTVTGTTNSDGSVTAQSIQIRPAGVGFEVRGAQTQ
ncbi:MAG TPA: DUF5666 domain-containing protein [Candidatus Paceibacterota bacterium]|nr:DUF5666 domain-containing protein [Candidatus Paceibacterota bacterium]